VPPPAHHNPANEREVCFSALCTHTPRPPWRRTAPRCRAVCRRRRVAIAQDEHSACRPHSADALCGLPTRTGGGPHRAAALLVAAGPCRRVVIARDGCAACRPRYAAASPSCHGGGLRRTAALHTTAGKSQSPGTGVRSTHWTAPRSRTVCPGRRRCVTIAACCLRSAAAVPSRLRRAAAQRATAGGLRARSVMSAPCSRPPQQRWPSVPQPPTRRDRARRARSMLSSLCALQVFGRAAPRRQRCVSPQAHSTSDCARRTHSLLSEIALPTESPAVLAESRAARHRRVPPRAHRDRTRRARSAPSLPCRRPPQPELRWRGQRRLRRRATALCRQRAAIRVPPALRGWALPSRAGRGQLVCAESPLARLDPARRARCRAPSASAPRTAELRAAADATRSCDRMRSSPNGSKRSTPAAPAPLRPGATSRSPAAARPARPSCHGALLRGAMPR
jgi:hypothetical protein